MSKLSRGKSQIFYRRLERFFLGGRAQAIRLAVRAAFVSVLGATLFGSAAAIAAERPLVAVIDGGVARTAELENVLLAEYDFAGESPRPAFEPRYDHGTYVATVLHRAARGGVDIVSLRIDDPADCAEGLNPPCQPHAQPIAAAIDKAVELGADAINISFSLMRDPSIDRAVQRAASKGVHVVLAAGNEGAGRPGNLSVATAGYPNAVLVGALDLFGEPWEKSNRPDTRVGIDYRFAWRPGVDVATTGTNDTPARASGTSMAAPMETAAIVTRRQSREAGNALPPTVTRAADIKAATALEVATASSTDGNRTFGQIKMTTLLHVVCGLIIVAAFVFSGWLANRSEGRNAIRRDPQDGGPHLRDWRIRTALSDLNQGGLRQPRLLRSPHRL